MNEDTRKLLMEQNTIILPEVLEHDTYALMVEAILRFRSQEIRLFCNGNGGNARVALAIVDLIQSHGKVIGYLPGEAYSSHVTVWAACSQRFIFPHSSIGVHRLTKYEDGLPADALTMGTTAREYEQAEKHIADILGRACKTQEYHGEMEYDYHWWLQTLQRHNGLVMTTFSAEQILMMGMAKVIDVLLPLVPATEEE